LSKLRVHDLASEFGVSSDEVINLLRQMDVPVRSHLSPLSDDQVARIRARWEREKRARVAAPPAATRRRRGTAAAAPAPEPKPEPASAEGASVRRRRRAAEPVAETPVIEPPARTQVSIISRPAWRTRSRSSPRRRSKQISGCKLPSPAWNTFASCRLWRALMR